MPKVDISFFFPPAVWILFSKKKCSPEIHCDLLPYLHEALNLTKLLHRSEELDSSSGKWARSIYEGRSKLYIGPGYPPVCSPLSLLYSVRMHGHALGYVLRHCYMYI